MCFDLAALINPHKNGYVLWHVLLFRTIPACGVILTSRHAASNLQDRCVDAIRFVDKGTYSMANFAVLRRRAGSTQHGIISPCRRRAQQDGTVVCME